MPSSIYPFHKSLSNNKYLSDLIKWIAKLGHIDPMIHQLEVVDTGF